MSGIISGFSSSPAQNSPADIGKSGVGVFGATLWGIGSKTIGALSTAATTIRSKTVNVIKTVGSGAKTTLRAGGILAHGLYNATQAGLQGLVGRRRTPEQTAEMWEEILFDAVDDVVQKKIAEGLEKLQAVSIQDEMISKSSQQAKKMKVDYVRDVSKTLDSQSGMRRKLLSSLFSALASSIEETSESDELDKNEEAYQLFCHFIIPLLQKDLNEKSIKIILGQAIGYTSQMIRKFDTYAKKYGETHETFDPDSFIAGLAEQFHFTSLEQVKEDSIRELTPSLERVIHKTREISTSKSLKESAALWAASKIPTALIGMTARATLETLEAHLREELLEKLLPLFEELLSIDASKEKIEIYFTIFFWQLLVPALVKVIDSVASSPTHLSEDVINRHLERAASDLMETLGIIIQDTSFKEDATLSTFIKGFESPKGKNTIAQLIKGIIKSRAIDSVRSIPLSGVKNVIEDVSKAEFGTKGQLYTIAGQAVMKSIDLPYTVGSIVQIIKHVITQ